MPCPSDFCHPIWNSLVSIIHHSILFTLPVYISLVYIHTLFYLIFYMDSSPLFYTWDITVRGILKINFKLLARCKQIYMKITDCQLLTNTNRRHAYIKKKIAWIYKTSVLKNSQTFLSAPSFSNATHVSLASTKSWTARSPSPSFTRISTLLWTILAFALKKRKNHQKFYYSQTSFSQIQI